MRGRVNQCGAALTNVLWTVPVHGGITTSMADVTDTPDMPRDGETSEPLDRALGDAEAFIGTMQALGDKLAVLVLQFAYDFTPDLYDRLDLFLAALPGGTRYAVEVRNRGWLKPELREMLSQHNVALVLQDLHTMPRLDWITADFTVIRWLGRRKDIARFDEIQIDRSKELEEWAGKVHRFLADGVNVYGFFNNHFAGHSPESVRQFAALLGMELMDNPKESNTGTQMAMGFDNE